MFNLQLLNSFISSCFFGSVFKLFALSTFVFLGEMKPNVKICMENSPEYCFTHKTFVLFLAVFFIQIIHKTQIAQLIFAAAL